MTSVIIIGAGPAGISIGYYLKSCQVNYLIVEQGSVGETWQRQYDALKLDTHKSISNLNNHKISAANPSFLTAKQFADYLLEFKTKNQINVKEQTKVLHAFFDSVLREWTVQTTQGVFKCNMLITATGLWSYPYTPDIEGLKTFNGNSIHSSLYKNHSPYKNKRVIVIGSGNSGVDIAVDLARNGTDVSMSVRQGVNLYPKINSAALSKLFIYLYRSVVYTRFLKYLLYLNNKKQYCKDLPKHPNARIDPRHSVHFGLELINLVKEKKIKIVKQIAKIQDSTIFFTDNSSDTFDSIILATGYRANLNFIKENIKNGESKSWEFHPSLNLFCVAGNLTTIIFDLRRIARQIASKIAQTNKYPARAIKVAFNSNKKMGIIRNALCH